MGAKHDREVAAFEGKRAVALVKLIVHEYVKEVEQRECWCAGVSCTHIVVEECQKLGDRLLEKFKTLAQRGA